MQYSESKEQERVKRFANAAFQKALKQQARGSVKPSVRLRKVTGASRATIEMKSSETLRPGRPRRQFTDADATIAIEKFRRNVYHE